MGEKLEGRKNGKNQASRGFFMRILLHTCCGPCAVFPLDLLKNNQVEIYFYNPNVYPAEEYKKRKKTVQQVAKKYGWSFSEGKYEPKVWQKAIQGYEHEPENSQRCLLCFGLRLQQTAKEAKQKGFAAFATTLATSAFKDVAAINQLGREIAKKEGIKYLAFNLSAEERRQAYYKHKHITKEMNLYHQKYCGCVYSTKNNINKKTFL